MPIYKKYLIYTAVLLLLLIGLGVIGYYWYQVRNQGDNSYAPFIMHDGILYRETSSTERLAPEDVEYKEYQSFNILSTVSSTQLPKTNGESNSAEEGQIYYFDHVNMRIYLRIDLNGYCWYQEYLPFDEWKQQQSG